MAPSLNRFKIWLKENNDITLSHYQEELAASALNFRNVIFSGGLRSGRTTVLRLIDKYYKDKHPKENQYIQNQLDK